MFGLHARAVSTNKHAKRMTDCTYLAQAQMERLHMLPWSSANHPADLQDVGSDSTGAWSWSDGFNNPAWAFLPHPNSGAMPNAVNAANGPYLPHGPRRYYITWDVEIMDSNSTWARIRVRCQYRDNEFTQWRGTTISSYRFRDK